MANFYTGKGGRATIGGAIYKVTSWYVTLTTQLLKSTNSESGGFEEYECGVQGGEFNVNFNYEVGTTPGATLMPTGGTKTLSVALALTGGSKIVSGTGAVGEFRVTNEVEGLVPCVLTGRFTGGVTLTSF